MRKKIPLQKTDLTQWIEPHTHSLLCAWIDWAFKEIQVRSSPGSDFFKGDEKLCSRHDRSPQDLDRYWRPVEKRTVH